MPLTATTFTLPCHKEQVRPIGFYDGLECIIQNACQGLSITPEQLRRELEENGDIPDLVSGELRPAALRSTAETLSTVQYARDALESSQLRSDVEPYYPCWRQIQV
ncbi:MAG: hypothetical protein M3120_10210 [Pseudomonadota bacterium]|nr:hypothetical protein [Pseudomonadota bacterium]